MKTLLAVSLLALLALPAHADNNPVYDISGSADFVLAGGNTLDVSFSYTLYGNPFDQPNSISNLQFSTTNGYGTWELFNSNPFDLQWSNSGQPNNGVAPTTGLLFNLEMTPAFPNAASLSLFDFSQPFSQGPYLATSGTFQAVLIPELSSLYLLATGLIGLAILKLRTV